jgi:MoxR-like ATPase
VHTVSPAGFAAAIENALRINRLRPLFGWGKPGVGKTAIVKQAAARRGIPVVDVRLGQLAPTDLRGMPVVDHATATTRWYRPVFLPTSGEGILLLDEFNQAPPTMQGIAQQLLLARRLGEYEVPDGWLILALGNRKEDRASVYDMPAQVENRFKHYLVEESLEDWRRWALGAGLPDEIVSFLLFRPALLHRYEPTERAWPSPRTWEFAAEQWRAGEDIISCVGAAAAGEFASYLKRLESLPDINRILAGSIVVDPLPEDLSVRYALITALAARARSEQELRAAFLYVTRLADDEWCRAFVQFAIDAQPNGAGAKALARIAASEPELGAFVQRFASLWHA